MAPFFFPTECVRDLDQLNLVKLGYGCLVLGLSQFSPLYLFNLKSVPQQWHNLPMETSSILYFILYLCNTTLHNRLFIAVKIGLFLTFFKSRNIEQNKQFAKWVVFKANERNSVIQTTNTVQALIVRATNNFFHNYL